MTLNLDEAMEVFAQIVMDAAPELSTPDGCAGECGPVAYNFLELLGGLGIEGVNVALFRDEFTHVVTISDEKAIDWTARQMDEGAPFPLVRPFAEMLAEGWQVIGHQTYAGMMARWEAQGAKE